MAQVSNRDLAFLGLVAVAVGTHVFTAEASKLGWKPIAISSALYVAGRLANQW